jgi:hypothetical protein
MILIVMRPSSRKGEWEILPESLSSLLEDRDSSPRASARHIQLYNYSRPEKVQ